jgi:hypothetical protein
VEDWPDIPGVESWMSGTPFSAPISTPIQLYWDPNDEEGPAQPLYKPGIPMMAREVLSTLRSAGVDNIDAYDVEMRSHASAEIDRSYVAFNLIGLVAAADRSKSKIVADGGPPLIAVGFDAVSIDTRSTLGQLMFRLAENVTAIVVHDRIKNALEAKHTGLSFVEPEHWFG